MGVPSADVVPVWCFELACKRDAGGVPRLLSRRRSGRDEAAGCFAFGWCEVGLLVAEHGQDDVAATAGQAHDGGVVLLAFGAFAVVEGPGLWVAQGGERGEEHGVLQPVVPRVGSWTRP